MGLKLDTAAMSRVAPTPSSTPTSPPSRLSVIASMRNWMRMSGLGAHRDPDADLPGPLGDTDQHDVHDADAADEQREPGDGPQQEGDREVAVFAVSAISCWLKMLKSSPASAEQAVPLAQQSRDLLLRRIRDALGLADLEVPTAGSGRR